MKNRIDKLKEIITNHESQISDLKGKVQDEFDQIFVDSPIIREAIIALESSEKYYFDDFCWVGQWAHVDLKKFDDCKNELNVFLRENHCCTFDFKNGAIQSNGSPELILESNGDVYNQESEEVIIESGEYKNSIGLKKLIDDHCEVNGYFPGLFVDDCMGGAELVNLDDRIKDEAERRDQMNDDDDDDDDDDY